MASRPWTLTRLDGVRVGCAEDPEGRTGVTVLRFDRPRATVVDVRGRASATLDTHSLELAATFGRRDALFFSGGSVHGLDAGRGVRVALLNAGRGEPVFGRGPPLPRVSGAGLYDLRADRPDVPDYLPLGFAATESASRAPVPIGAWGAGAGARVAKLGRPGRSRPGGQSSSAVRTRSEGGLGVFVVFNSVGALRDWERDRWIVRPARTPRVGRSRRSEPAESGTTLAAVVTELDLDRRALYALAEHVHDGIARTVVPAHTSAEGDLVFASATAARRRRSPAGLSASEEDRLGWAAERLVLEAARRLFA